MSRVSHPIVVRATSEPIEISIVIETSADMSVVAPAVTPATINATEIALKAIELYAAMHPRPSHVTQVQAAEMMGRSEPTIRKLVRCGTLPLNACGMIPITAIDKALAGR